jgi:predicted O-methyltransferase YrrM
MGASAHAMLLAAPEDFHIWCIDKFMVAGTEFVTRQVLETPIRTGQCEIIVGDSERGAEMLEHMKGKVDLVFVDDGHATEDVLRDIRCLKPLLRPGGIMVGHDFEVPHNDVAMGVIKSGISYDVPIPRLWRHIA